MSKFEHHHRLATWTCWLLMAVFAAVAVTYVASTEACPFCSAVSQTFAEEISSLDAAAFVKLVAAPKEGSDDEEESPLSDFEIVSVLKGAEYVRPGQKIRLHYFGKPHDGLFIVMGTDSPDIIWTSPLGLSEKGVEYIQQVVKLPESPERLEFFQEYLEDSDEMLARDAYDEFAKAPYEDVVALKDAMNRERILGWIKDTENVPASRRRLYLTMLGVCGQPEDAQLLEQYMRSESREDKLGLDAMVACYLTLSGADGLADVKELFLSNKDAEYADTYSAIMAMRFHLAETECIPKDDLLDGLRCLLERPDLADLVIPDLARAEDWSVMPRLIELYGEANEESNWIRVPIVNYVRACPLPAAEQAMATLTKIDPDAVKRASTFFPLGPKPKKDDLELVDGQTDGEALASDAATNPPTEAPTTAPVPPPDVDQSLAPAATGSPTTDVTSTPSGWLVPILVIFGLVAVGAIARGLLGKTPTSS